MLYTIQEVDTEALPSAASSPDEGAVGRIDIHLVGVRGQTAMGRKAYGGQQSKALRPKGANSPTEASSIAMRANSGHSFLPIETPARRGPSDRRRAGRYPTLYINQESEKSEYKPIGSISNG